MNQLFQKVKAQGLAILVSGITGICVASAILYSKADDYVAEAYKAEATKFRAEFSIACSDGYPVNIPKVFSKGESFKPKKEGRSFLKSKIGFKYEVDDTVCVKTGNLLEDCVGRRYVFSVEEDMPNGAREDLTIYNFMRDVFPGSYVSLKDNNHDGLLDWVSIRDDVNNTSVLITRDSDGDLEYSNLDEAAARQVYDLYSLKFHAFKAKYNIDKAILDYSPKMEIKEITPKETGK